MHYFTIISFTNILASIFRLTSIQPYLSIDHTSRVRKTTKYKGNSKSVRYNQLKKLVHLRVLIVRSGHFITPLSVCIFV